MKPSVSLLSQTTIQERGLNLRVQEKICGQLAVSNWFVGINHARLQSKQPVILCLIQTHHPSIPLYLICQISLPRSDVEDHLVADKCKYISINYLTSDNKRFKLEFREYLIPTSIYRARHLTHLVISNHRVTWTVYSYLCNLPANESSHLNILCQQSGPNKHLK